MINQTKTIVINASSVLETGEVVATMHASINESGNTSTSTSIVNNELYKANKELVRADIDVFEALYRAEEDAVEEVSK